MALLTSYKAKSTELNDTTNYSIPRNGTSFDDRNPTTGEYAYRKGDVPVLTGLTIKEGVLSLPIIINAKTDAEWKTKLQALKVIFQTADPTPWKFERKRPSDSVYSYIMVTVREFAVNVSERTVTVTLETSDRAWVEPAWLSQNITLFETAARTEDLVINYTGATPTEPIITLKLLTEGKDGPRPLYYHYVTVYTQGAPRVTGTPLLLVSGWNTSSMVTASEIRADGLDIEVEFASGQDIPRFIGGTAASRKVWIKPTAWPWRFDVVLGAPPDWNPMLEPADPMLATADTVAYATVTPSARPDTNGFTTEFPSSGTFMVDGEIVSYTGIQWMNAEMTLVKFTGLTRGVAGGTAAANHYEFRRMLFPTTLVVRYGYPPGYEHLMTHNNLNGWPLLDYEVSTNAQWTQTAFYSPYSGNYPWYTMNWVTYSKKQTPTDQRYWGEGIHATSIYGDEAVNRVAKMKLVGQNTGSPWTNTYRDYCRLSLNPFGQIDRSRGRVLSYVRFYPKLLSTAGRTITCRAKVVRSDFDRYTIVGGRSVALEVQEQLWVQSHTGATQTSYDSGWKWTGMWSKPFQSVCIELDHIPAGQSSMVDNLVLDKVEWLLDAEYGGSPVARTIGGQNGGSTVNVTVKNITDTQVGTTFGTNTLMGVDDTMTINCATRAVSGALLKEITYRNPTWLRLLPGNNTIRFVGLTNIGQVLATISWQVHN